MQALRHASKAVKSNLAKQDAQRARNERVVALLTPACAATAPSTRPAVRPSW